MDIRYVAEYLSKPFLLLVNALAGCDERDVPDVPDVVRFIISLGIHAVVGVMTG